MKKRGGIGLNLEQRGNAISSRPFPYVPNTGDGSLYVEHLAPQVHVMIVVAQISEDFHSRFGPQGLTSETLPHLY